ncbi:hypothetical protein Dsin_022246 [Dipteronia sinensis]|uniref:Exonuclease domain-containing protein n=1 Tax=Dipteronia sinensis TaxID=43782 RepID=A0AAE0A2M3_9ROSI|nr:hypothetical protein Dsin_022246 [Dipteronia sinensis]
MAFSKVSLFRYINFFSLPPPPLPRLRTLSCSQYPFCSLYSSSSSTSSSASSSDSSTWPPQKNTSPRWRPTCLYFTQEKCTMMDDPVHLEKFNHDISKDLQVNAAAKCSQDLDFFLVLDLEGKIEILEFPVIMIDAKTMAFVDFFHRFVRPTEMSEQHINKYIEGKYGKFGVDRVWHDTAIPFTEVLQQFEAWLIQHRLLGKEQGSRLNRAAFVTCGNWDLKTKIPSQCNVSKIKLPPYFMEWINLKDVFYNFYKTKKSEASGMRSMMNNRKIPMFGSHHLGIDDTKNIARVLQHMLADGAQMSITASRNPDSQNVEFLFENRI